MDQQKQQEIMLKLSLYEQQMQQIQQQLQLVEQSTAELTSLDIGLDDLKGSKGKEIMAPIGRGIFIKSKLISEELIVDIGGKNFVKKSIAETKKLIEVQIKKLEEVKENLTSSLEEINNQMIRLIMQAQAEAQKSEDIKKK